MNQGWDDNHLKKKKRVVDIPHSYHRIIFFHSQNVFTQCQKPTKVGGAIPPIFLFLSGMIYGMDVCHMDLDSMDSGVKNG